MPTNCSAAKQLPQFCKHPKSADLLRKSLLSHVWQGPKRQKPYLASMHGFLTFRPWRHHLTNSYSPSDTDRLPLPPRGPHGSPIRPVTVPRCISPAVNTFGTLVAYPPGFVATLVRPSRSTLNASVTYFWEPRKPAAISTRSAFTVYSLPSIGTIIIRPVFSSFLLSSFTQHSLCRAFLSYS